MSVFYLVKTRKMSFFFFHVDKRGLFLLMRAGNKSKCNLENVCAPLEACTYLDSLLPFEEKLVPGVGEFLSTIPQGFQCRNFTAPLNLRTTNSKYSHTAAYLAQQRDMMQIPYVYAGNPLRNSHFSTLSLFPSIIIM